VSSRIATSPLRDIFAQFCHKGEAGMPSKKALTEGLRPTTLHNPATFAIAPNMSSWNWPRWSFLGRRACFRDHFRPERLLSSQALLARPETGRTNEKSTGKGTSSTRAELSCYSRAALAAEVCFETRTPDFSTWNLFRKFLNVARRRLFVVESYARLFLKTLYGYRREGKFALHAFVVMPEHVHLLITPSENVTIERAIQLIKGGYSHALGSEIGRKREIWQRGFTDHRIRDSNDFMHHREYIHQNPVVRGLVTVPSEYRYSSAYPGFKLDPWPPAAKAALLESA
jgi:putative transposase